MLSWVYFTIGRHIVTCCICTRGIPYPLARTDSHGACSSHSLASNSHNYKNYDQTQNTRTTQNYTTRKREGDVASSRPPNRDHIYSFICIECGPSRRSPIHLPPLQTYHPIHNFYSLMIFFSHIIINHIFITYNHIQKKIL